MLEGKEPGPGRGSESEEVPHRALEGFGVLL